MNPTQISYLTESSGRPTAVVVTLKEWRRITESLGIALNRGLMASLARSKSQLRRHVPLLTLKEVLRKLKRAHQSRAS